MGEQRFSCGEIHGRGERGGERQNDLSAGGEGQPGVEGLQLMDGLAGARRLAGSREGEGKLEKGGLILRRKLERELQFMDRGEMLAAGEEYGAERGVCSRDMRGKVNGLLELATCRDEVTFRVGC